MAYLVVGSVFDFAVSEGRAITEPVTAPHRISRVTVFTGSADGSVPGYKSAAQRAAAELAQADIEIVYGGGKTGLMGAVADAALAVGGRVHGVMPRALVESEIVHPGLTTIEVVEDMHARKARMAKLGDAFVAFPGGAGTLEEFFEVWTWQQLGIHAKPVALLNINGFWDGLLKAIDGMIVGGFLRPQYRDSLIVESTMPKLLEQMAAWSEPEVKWAKAS